jgi:hypothetical protein
MEEKRFPCHSFQMIHLPTLVDQIIVSLHNEYHQGSYDNFFNPMTIKSYVIFQYDIEMILFDDVNLKLIIKQLICLAYFLFKQNEIKFRNQSIEKFNYTTTTNANFNDYSSSDTNSTIRGKSHNKIEPYTLIFALDKASDRTNNFERRRRSNSNTKICPFHIILRTHNGIESNNDASRVNRLVNMGNMSTNHQQFDDIPCRITVTYLKLLCSNLNGNFQVNKVNDRIECCKCLFHCHIPSYNDTEVYRQVQTRVDDNNEAASMTFTQPLLASSLGSNPYEIISNGTRNPLKKLTEGKLIVCDIILYKLMWHH